MNKIYYSRFSGIAGNSLSISSITIFTVNRVNIFNITHKTATGRKDFSTLDEAGCAVTRDSTSDLFN